MNCVFDSGVISNNGQFPESINEAQDFLSTGPMCRYACDLIPMLKSMAEPGELSQLKLDTKVKSDYLSLDLDITT